MSSISFLGSGEELTVSFDGTHFSSLFKLPSLSKSEGQQLLLELSRRWPNMGGDLHDFSLPKILVKDGLDRNFVEIVFYGGTFNPWHEGHTACLTLTPKKNIIVIPDVSPWKEYRSSDPWGEYLSLVNRLKETPFALYPGFLAKENSNPTIDWIDHSQIQKISLLIGDDNFLKIKKWKESNRLLKRISVLYVAPRTERALSLIKYKDELEGEFKELKVEILKDHPYAHLSSTNLRKNKH